MRGILFRPVLGVLLVVTGAVQVSRAQDQQENSTLDSISQDAESRILTGNTTQASTESTEFTSESPESSDYDVTRLESGCYLNGLSYAVGDHFYKGCDEYCICQENGTIECFEIDCPSKFGLDVLSPQCIEWNNHEDFVPSPPTCCPPVPTCMSTGECEYKDEIFPNYETIPMNLTGCEQRCYCDDAIVQCQEACNTLSTNPPPWLPCQPSRAIKVPEKDRPCCEMWDCRETNDCSVLPTRLQDTKINPVNATHISIRFDIPAIMGIYEGFLQIQYTAGFSGTQDHSSWPRKKFTFSDGVFPEGGGIVEHIFGPVAPDTQYFVKPSAFVEECENRLIADDIKPVRTPPSIQIPKVETVYLDMAINASEVTHSAAMIEWRHFTIEEKIFVDGVQLQYWILNNGNLVSQVPQTSPILHRDTTYHQLNNLKPDSSYEVNLDVVQVEGAARELYSDRKLMFKTEPYVDVYDFDLKVELVGVNEYSAVIRWIGPPSPEQKYVSIFRIIYYADDPNSIQDEISLYKISDSFSSPQINITSLYPETQYKLWIEAYLRNGKKIKSNVAEFMTEIVADGDPYAALPSTDDGEGEGSEYYYKIMVAMAIIACFALVAFLILLYFYMHQNITYTVTMNKPSKESKKNGANDSTMFGNSGYKRDSLSSGGNVEMNSVHSNINGIN